MATPSWSVLTHPPRGVIPGALSYTLHNTLGVLYLNGILTPLKVCCQHQIFNSVSPLYTHCTVHMSVAWRRGMVGTCNASVSCEWDRHGWSVSQSTWSHRQLTQAIQCIYKDHAPRAIYTLCTTWFAISSKNTATM